MTEMLKMGRSYAWQKARGEIPRRTLKRPELDKVAVKTRYVKFQDFIGVIFWVKQLPLANMEIRSIVKYGCFQK